MAPKFCIKTHEDLCLEVAPKRGLHDLCGRKFRGKNCTKKFRESLGKSGQNPWYPKNLPAPTPMTKRHLRPRCLSLIQRGKQARDQLGTPGVAKSWQFATTRGTTLAKSFLRGATFFKLCPIVLTYNTLFQGGP